MKNVRLVLVGVTILGSLQLFLTVFLTIVSSDFSYSKDQGVSWGTNHEARQELVNNLIGLWTPIAPYLWQVLTGTGIAGYLLVQRSGADRD